jgi:hypothetical protein
VIAAFDRANLVALGERHWTIEDSQFRLNLIRRPAFARAVNDIVIEFGNPRYQPLLDRFIEGESVPAADLQLVWRDTTQPGAFDSPVYEEFLRAVRALNAGLRVLAADYPIDWTAISQPSDLDALMRERDRSAATIIQREVLDKQRKALVIFGAAHLYRNRPETIVDLLKDDPRAKWFVVAPVGGPGLPATEPALLDVAGSDLASLPAAGVLEIGSKRIKIVGGKPVLVPVFASDVKLGDLIDAGLYFGEAPPQFVQPSPEIYAGTDYGREVQRRRQIINLAMS